GRHCRLDFALGRYILGTYDILGAGRCRRHRWRHDPLDARQEASGTIERHLVARAVEESGEQRLLGTDEIRDSRFDPGLADQVVDVDGAVLSEAIDPADSLLEHGGVPGKLDVDARARGSLQVETDAAGVGREEHAARGVVVEVDDVLRAPLLALLAGEERRPDALVRELVARRPVREPEHPAPLAEHHHFALLSQSNLTNELAELQDFRP